MILLLRNLGGAGGERVVPPDSGGPDPSIGPVESDNRINEGLMKVIEKFLATVD